MDKLALFDALRSDPFPGEIKGAQVVAICKLVDEGMELDALAQRLTGAFFPGDTQAAAAFERALQQAGY